MDKISFAFERDPIEKVKTSLAYCFNDQVFAENYVDAITDLAIDAIMENPKKIDLSNIVLPIINEILSDICKSDMISVFQQNYLDNNKMRHMTLKKYQSNTFSGWPQVSEFNIKLGLEKIEEYIHSWQKCEEWMVYTEFLGFESEESTNYFVYEVEFSRPSPTYPIPQGTASIYFSIEVPKIIPFPYDAPVQVTYMFETCNVIHVPGRIEFQESWMTDLLQRKLNFFKTLTF